jgi:hypothetical protein
MAYHSQQLPHVAVEHGEVSDAQDQSVCHCRRYGRDWLRGMERLDQQTCRAPSLSHDPHQVMMNTKGLAPAELVDFTFVFP